MPKDVTVQMDVDKSADDFPEKRHSIFPGIIRIFRFTVMVYAKFNSNEAKASENVLWLE